MGFIQNLRNLVSRDLATTETLPNQDIELTEFLLGIGKDKLTVDHVKEIPGVMEALEFIANNVAISPTCIYKESNGKVEEIIDDRYFMLNYDTRDTLTPFEFKHAIVMDYFLYGGAWVYVDRYRNKIKGLYYVPFEEVAVSHNKYDPIFKDYKIMVRGRTYQPYDFMRILRNSRDGYTGKSILSENFEKLSTAYNTMEFENKLVKSGGSKKGFVQSERKLSREAIGALKKAWDDMYSKNESGVVVLNEGLKFQEASSTSVEMQLNQNKESNKKDMAGLFGLPFEILSGNVTDQVFNNAIKMCVVPVISAIESAMNRDLLLRTEQKNGHYFDFDLSGLIRGDLPTRYQAYNDAINAGWISINEVRRKENMTKYEGMDVLTMNLGQVIYDTEKQVYFTPNTKVTSDLATGEVSVNEGGNNRGRDQEDVPGSGEESNDDDQSSDNEAEGRSDVVQETRKGGE